MRSLSSAWGILFLVFVGGCATTGTTTTTVSRSPDGSMKIEKHDSEIDQALKVTQSAANAAQATENAAQAGLLIKALADSL